MILEFNILSVKKRENNIMFEGGEKRHFFAVEAQNNPCIRMMPCIVLLGHVEDV